MKRRKLSPSLHPTSSSGDPQKRVNDILLCVEHKLKNEDKQGEALRPQNKTPYARSHTQSSGLGFEQQMNLTG